MKNLKNKSDKVLDNLGQVYPYVWNQYSLGLKNCLKTHWKYSIVEKIKDAVKLWLIIKETLFNSTSTINST